MAHLPVTISPMRWAGTPSSFATRYYVSPIGIRNSSRSNSPGVTGFSLPVMTRGPSVVVDELDVHRTDRRPPKADPGLIVDANASAKSLRERVAKRADHEIRNAARD